MMPKHIKEARDRLLAAIQEAQASLEELQENCPHENQIEGLYSWRVGNIHPALICDDCWKLIRLLDSDQAIERKPIKS